MRLRSLERAAWCHDVRVIVANIWWHSSVPFLPHTAEDICGAEYVYPLRVRFASYLSTRSNGVPPVSIGWTFSFSPFYGSGLCCGTWFHLSGVGDRKYLDFVARKASTCRSQDGRPQVQSKAKERVEETSSSNGSRPIRHVDGWTWLGTIKAIHPMLVGEEGDVSWIHPSAPIHAGCS